MSSAVIASSSRYPIFIFWHSDPDPPSHQSQLFSNYIIQSHRSLTRRGKPILEPSTQKIYNAVYRNHIPHSSSFNLSTATPHVPVYPANLQSSSSARCSAHSINMAPESRIANPPSDRQSWQPAHPLFLLHSGLQINVAEQRSKHPAIAQRLIGARSVLARRLELLVEIITSPSIIHIHLTNEFFRQTED